ncbi:spermidine synthase [Hoeflea prorocentri]|uniref:Spermidine synthase n=1 Tax=Hoeflea prorocentri TaxID=1922333 RepID=A0A9X3ZHS2_9HYPH|nr:spermidine synthase [Hoeflea prorocentri]MCY6381223.1 spermidine synthase [Hoeflea prorocentri]MDA5399023.1 spermidine synthase [Hoeflea prorocentri]
MSSLFEEIDYAPTPIGPVSLRRRRILSLGTDVFEILLGDEHLMSSLFTASEVALAKLGIAQLACEAPDILVGGLGLGYTAQAVLEHSYVRSLTVIEMLEPVIRWHEEGLVPLTPPLKEDARCRIVQGDFFELAASENGFDAQALGRQYDAILIDIDHTPEHFLDDRSSSFYSTAGFDRLARHVRPGGVVGLWSDAVTDDVVTERLSAVFDEAKAEPVTFPNPLQDNKPFTQTVYVAQKR